MKKKIVVKLGRLCGYLDKLEDLLPGNHGCTTIINKARILAQQIKEDLSAEKSNSVTVDKVACGLKCLMDVLTLLDRLKNYFNFYQQPFYEHKNSS